MKTIDILNLDCRKKENRDFIGKVLRKKNLVDPDRFPLLEDLEKSFQELCLRYGYNIQGIKPYFELKENRDRFVFYDVSIIRRDQVDGGSFINHWIGNITGKDMWEVFAKMIIKIYSDNKAEERKEKSGQ